MRQAKLELDGLRWATLSKFAAVAVLAGGCFPALSMAQQPGQKTFSSAQEASQAIVTAAQNNDKKAMLEILGPDATQIVSSGMTPKTLPTAPNSCSGIRKCIVS